MKKPDEKPYRIVFNQKGLFGHQDVYDVYFENKVVNKIRSNEKAAIQIADLLNIAYALGYNTGHQSGSLYINY